MPKYLVTFTEVYEVEAESEAQALETAHDAGKFRDGDCFAEESYF